MALVLHGNKPLVTVPGQFRTLHLHQDQNS